MAMSREHKDALARGRKEAKAIKAYLRAIDERKPGRSLTKASIQAKLHTVNSRLGAIEDPLQRLDLFQSRLDLQQAMDAMDDQVDPNQIEAGFVASARSYAERKGISYTAWREYGVPASVLKKAGIPETRRR